MFAVTIHKAQGQTLKHVGIYLTSPVFSHGHLYVVVSIASSFDNVALAIIEGH
jgi:ATP-dependent DNA helicase PIF1